MRSGFWVLVVLSAFSLAAGCGRSGGTVTAPLISETIDSTPVCPPARGEGTVSPAISIYSITFVVNGLEQVVRGEDTLQALPGDKVQVSEVTICTGSFPGNGGEACVDFAPAGQSGQEIVSEHGGTHLVQVTAGFISIPGPSQTWSVGENWRHISAVLNHWPPEETKDLACSEGRCERDDRVVIGLR